MDFKKKKIIRILFLAIIIIFSFYCSSCTSGIEIQFSKNDLEKNINQEDNNGNDKHNDNDNEIKYGPGPFYFVRKNIDNFTEFKEFLEVYNTSNNFYLTFNLENSDIISTKNYKFTGAVRREELKNNDAIYDKIIVLKPSMGYEFNYIGDPKVYGHKINLFSIKCEYNLDAQIKEQKDIEFKFIENSENQYIYDILVGDQQVMKITFEINSLYLENLTSDEKVAKLMNLLSNNALYIS